MAPKHVILSGAKNLCWARVSGWVPQILRSAQNDMPESLFQGMTCSFVQFQNLRPLPLNITGLACYNAVKELCIMPDMLRYVQREKN